MNLNEIIRKGVKMEEKVSKEAKVEGLEELSKTARSLKPIIEGRVVVLFGAPMVGKTLFAHVLSREFETAKLLKIDKNYKDEYKFINPKLEYIEINNPRQFFYELNNLAVNPLTLIIIDSITTIASDFLGERLYMSPRAYGDVARFQDVVLNRLSKLRGLATTLAIAHERLLDFETREVGPRMNLISLRNTDMVLRMVQEDGNRIIRVWKKRERPEKLEPIKLEI